MAHPARRQVWGRSSSDGEGSEVERLAEDERGDREDVSLRIWVILLALWFCYYERDGRKWEG